MQVRWRNLAVVALVLLSVGLVFVLSQHEGGIPRTELLPSSGSMSGGAAPVRATMITPARTPGGPTLVMIQGLKAQRLVIWPMDGSAPPMEVDRSVSIWPLLPSPDGTRVLYGTQHTVMVFDIASRRSIIVGTLPGNGRLIYAQWSPDSRSVAYVVQTPLYLSSFYTRADGSTDARVMLEVPQGLDLDVGWLPSGDPVAITLGLGARGGLQTIYQHFDPGTGVLRVLPSDAEVIQPWSPLRSPDRMQQIYATKSWEDARYKGACRTGPLALTGPEWLPLVARSMSVERRVVFEMDGLFMDRPTWLDDGRIVFRVVADPICTASDSGFYVGAIGQDPVKLVDAEPEYVADDADKLLWTSSYALGPEQARIAWNETDMQQQRSRIYVRGLDAAPETEPELLFETTPPDSDAPFTFQDEQMILYFIWLP